MLAFHVSHSGSRPCWNTLQFAATGFDTLFKEIFSTWASGGTLVMVDEDVRRDPRTLLRYLDEQQVHRLYLPFAALSVLAETARQTGHAPTELREVFAAGEQLHCTPAVRQFFAATGATLFNQYGPAETHMVTTERLSNNPAEWPSLPPIGRAIDNAAVDIRDARGRLLPPLVPGEIWVSGVPVADGYIGQADLTAQRFVRLPDGTRAYRTGDIGRMIADGRLEFLGRRDDQVKIRGYRVELGEVESRIRALPGVRDAAVVVHELRDIDRRLVAFVIPTDADATPSTADIRRQLRVMLPDYMLPTRCVPVNAFPLTATGKVDRRALLAAMPEAPTPDDLAPGSAEHRIALIWSDLLQVEIPSLEMGFFELGGHSLLAALLATRLQDEFGMIVPVVELFAHATIADQAELLERLYEREVVQMSVFAASGSDLALDGYLEP
jgi:acyl-coenzyme A synthetase/AMP-(fatty) acid ligase